MAVEKEHILEKVSNFRDVGQTVNSFLDNASPEDMVYLADSLGIRTVIDLRTNTELARQAAKRTAIRLVDPSIPATARIPGIQYHEIKVTGRRFERHVASLLTWWQFFQFLFLYACGYRDQAVRVVAEHVLVPRGLLGIGRDKLDHSGEEIAAALRLYSQRRTTPVLVHCTQGKDRTGLICCLVLMVLGVPMAAIEHDYGLTDVGLARDREQLLKEVRAVGLTEAWAYTDRGMMTGIKRHLDERYGGLEAYLDGIGFDESERELMRETLLV
ncbi:Protein-tyrosine/Dual-specificity phosphatase [Cordyceps fumosorosea ARSEF 2679]|uniref:Protein-tyrosine/Dual-specificity phosphatase n=1 Tax=Cordyceps fumosorosea (strain ARSEF 2679) TaxID=1081104 RepID=A0A167YF67_CORFA|nr:Protein-tyrosine/Dual-specificity phosphatase [Cordyceps fumosorosea ARSEF 2679]OAA66255.1 Protein-tyrosine/Dual-specificity phosphatase [Cordyceps fumosorosea ARSEF 2679]